MNDVYGSHRSRGYMYTGVGAYNPQSAQAPTPFVPNNVTYPGQNQYAPPSNYAQSMQQQNGVPQMPNGLPQMPKGFTGPVDPTIENTEDGATTEDNPTESEKSQKC